MIHVTNCLNSVPLYSIVIVPLTALPVFCSSYPHKHTWHWHAASIFPYLTHTNSWAALSFLVPPVPLPEHGHTIACVIPLHSSCPVAFPHFRTSAVYSGSLSHIWPFPLSCNYPMHPTDMSVTYVTLCSCSHRCSAPFHNFELSDETPSSDCMIVLGCSSLPLHYRVISAWLYSSIVILWQSQILPESYPSPPAPSLPL